MTVLYRISVTPHEIEKLTERPLGTGPFEDTKIDLYLPLTWSEAKQAWYIVLYLDSVSCTLELRIQRTYK